MRTFLALTSLGLSLHAGILSDTFTSAIDTNRDMQIAYAGVALQKASSKNAQTLDNFNLQLDWYARYYSPQESNLHNANFGLPDKTVHEQFVKGNVNFTLSKELYNEGTDALQDLGEGGVKKASFF